MYLLLSLLISYLLGSIPFSLIISKVFFKKDIRDYGSKNLGGTNVGRVFGKTAGVSVIALDHLKAICAILITKFLVGTYSPQLIHIALSLSALCIVLGHCYPIFAKFKGGKAVACAFGILFISNIYIYIITGVIFLTILKISKYVSLSSMLSIFIAGLLFFIPHLQHSPLLGIDLKIYWSLTIVLISLFVVFQHRTNIKRLISKTENKIKWM